MKVDDAIYGESEIDDPLVLELIDTKAMQRLKGVNQYGTIELVYPEFETTRFDHCLGVYLLLKRFGAGREEQIAGLIHDIAHTCFSHAIDFGYEKQEEQNFHEEHHERIVLKSDIPSILKKEGFDVEELFDESKFRLMERDLPDLCADRIDYFLRDGYTFKILTKEDVEYFIKNLVVFEGEFVFKTEEAAKRFAKTFMKQASTWYASELETFLHIMGKMLVEGIEKGILTEDDLFTTDEKVLDKLRESEDESILQRLELFTTKKAVLDKEKYDYHYHAKIRLVAPKFITEEGLKRVTDVDEELKKIIDDERERLKEGFFTRLVDK